MLTPPSEVPVELQRVEDERQGAGGASGCEERREAGEGARGLLGPGRGGGFLERRSKKKKKLHNFWLCHRSPGDARILVSEVL